MTLLRRSCQSPCSWSIATGWSITAIHLKRRRYSLTILWQICRMDDLIIWRKISRKDRMRLWGYAALPAGAAATVSTWGMTGRIFWWIRESARREWKKAYIHWGSRGTRLRESWSHTNISTIYRDLVYSAGNIRFPSMGRRARSRESVAVILWGSFRKGSCMR